MTIVIIAAIADNSVIGNAGKIPWHIRDDLRRFKRLTLGYPIIMGRKTYNSLGKPLPGRRNIVLTRSPAITGIECFPNLDAALATCDSNTTVFIIGGAEIYRQALPVADTLLITHVHQSPTGDTKFPPYDHNEWRETSRIIGSECDYAEYQRIPRKC